MRLFCNAKFEVQLKRIDQNSAIEHTFPLKLVVSNKSNANLTRISTERKPERKPEFQRQIAIKSKTKALD